MVRNLIHRLQINITNCNIVSVHNFHLKWSIEKEVFQKNLHKEFQLGKWKTCQSYIISIVLQMFHPSHVCIGNGHLKDNNWMNETNSLP